MVASSKMRNGAVDNSSKSAKSGGSAKRVTAPVYDGAQASAPSVGERATPVLSGASIAVHIYSRSDSLRFATSELSETLRRLGIYEPAPAKGEDGTREHHENVLRIMNEELNFATKFALELLREAVHGPDSECDELAKDGEKQPDGPIMRTDYGRQIFNDTQVMIERLYNIQASAERVGESLLGKTSLPEMRSANVVDSVVACLSNLVDHLDDTVASLHRLNSDLLINLLGVQPE